MRIRTADGLPCHAPAPSPLRLKRARRTASSCRRLLAIGFALLAGWSIGSVGSSLAAAEPAHWNQWRGPQRTGEVPGGSWGEKLQGHLEELWSVSLEPSYSGPLVWGDTVFTTETVDRDQERVTALSLDGGDVRWTAQWPGFMAVPFFAAANGDWIRSTPICDGENLIVFGMRDRLVNLDPRTGKIRWEVDFPESLGDRLQPFGAVCSPLIEGDALFVQAGGGLCKIALADGEILWKTLEGGQDMMSGGAFSSPVIADIGGTRQLIVQTRLELCGVDPTDGSVLWRKPIEAFRGMNILTPLVIGDRVFTAAHSGKSLLLSIGNGRGDGGGDRWDVREVWDQKTQGYMSSPVLIDGYIYLHLKNQRFTCLDADSGEIRWTTPPFGKYWSMAHAGDKILALDADGTLRLIRADPAKFDLLDEVRVAEDSWAHLAVAGEHLIVRDLAALHVFRWDRTGRGE